MWREFTGPKVHHVTRTAQYMCRKDLWTVHLFLQCFRLPQKNDPEGMVQKDWSVARAPFGKHMYTCAQFCKYSDTYLLKTVIHCSSKLQLFKEPGRMKIMMDSNREVYTFLFSCLDVKAKCKRTAQL